MLNQKAIDVMKKYRKGGIVEEKDRDIVYNLESIGFMKTGFTHVHNNGEEIIGGIRYIYHDVDLDKSEMDDSELEKTIDKESLSFIKLNIPKKANAAHVYVSVGEETGFSYKIQYGKYSVGKFKKIGRPEIHSSKEFR